MNYRANLVFPITSIAILLMITIVCNICITRGIFKSPNEAAYKKFKERHPKLNSIINTLVPVFIYISLSAILCIYIYEYKENNPIIVHVCVYAVERDNTTPTTSIFVRILETNEKYTCKLWYDEDKIIVGEKYEIHHTRITKTVVYFRRL